MVLLQTLLSSPLGVSPLSDFHTSFARPIQSIAFLLRLTAKGSAKFDTGLCLMKARIEW